MVLMHIAAPAEFGGLERVVQTLALGFRGLGHDVHVVAVVTEAGADRSFFAPLASAGVHMHPLVLPSRGYLRERAAIADLLHRVRPDVVHTHGYRPDVLDAGVARRAGIPVVTTLHGFTHGGWRNWCYERLQYRAFRRFDAVVAVARPLVARLERAGVPRSRIHEVPNALSAIAPPLERQAARHALGVSPDSFVVGWVGRLSREKGPDVLLDALPHVADLPLDVSILGNGVERVSLEARARRLAVDGRIRWHGEVPDAGGLFAAFDVFVLSSRAEGTPVVLLEAMAAGVPIVATRVGGVPDVVSPAEAALVGADQPVALAAAMRAVYQDRLAAARRAGAARARLEREFGLAPWLDRYEAIYRRVTTDTPALVRT